MADRGREANSLFAPRTTLDLETGPVRDGVAVLTLLGDGQQRVIAGARANGVGVGGAADSVDGRVRERDGRRRRRGGTTSPAGWRL